MGKDEDVKMPSIGKNYYELKCCKTLNMHPEVITDTKSRDMVDYIFFKDLY